MKTKIIISSIIISLLISIIIYFSSLTILKTERRIIFNNYLNTFVIQLKNILTPYIVDNDYTTIKIKVNHLMVAPINFINIKYKTGEEYRFLSDELKKIKESNDSFTLDLKKYLTKSIEIKDKNNVIAKISAGISDKKIKNEVLFFTKQYILFSVFILIVLNLIIFYLLSKYLQGLEKFISELKSLDRDKPKKEFETQVKDIVPITNLINKLLVSIRKNMEALSLQKSTLNRAIKTRKEQLKKQLEKLIDLENKIIMAKKEVELTDKMSLLTNIYNDINNKLELPIINIIDEISEFLNNDKIEPEIKNKLEIARDSAHKILNLIYKIKNYTSLTKVSKTTIELNYFLEGIISDFSKKNKNINFIFEKSRDKIKILGNKTQLIESFHHIIRNSIEALREINNKNGEIKISVNINPPYVEIIFKDNGPGFQDIANAFNLFYTTKVNPKNKGYGLALVEKTILEHGGKTSLENLNEGGAIVKVFLPILNINK